MNAANKTTSRAAWRDKLYKIIFEADTRAGKLFDELLIVSILVSVFVVMLDSVSSIRARYVVLLHGVEWFFTILLPSNMCFA